MTSRYENILFFAVIGICSNLMCISTLSNELPPRFGTSLDMHASGRTMTVKPHKFGTRILSALDKLALLNRNEKMKVKDKTLNPEDDFRKNTIVAANPNYLLQQPRILPPPPPPPPTPYYSNPFNKVATKPYNTKNEYDDHDDDYDDEDDDVDYDSDYSAKEPDNMMKDDFTMDTVGGDNMLQHLMEDNKLDKEIALKSSGLLKLLLFIPNGPLPVIYIEENNIPPIPYYGLVKRGGRYNQRYPWKRENSLYRKESMHPETRFHCIPSREEVFRLLIGLHENRSGNQPKTVRFCNRRRPARSILTSIRFMG